MARPHDALDRIHDRWVHDRRVRVLARHIAELVPHGSSVLDVGCGDGRLANELAAQRGDITIRGADIARRPRAAVDVEVFDGRSLPFADGGAGTVLLVDVLHHAADPVALLREAARVARDRVIVKDHTREGLLAGPLLALMDWAGNRAHAVPMRYEYWRLERWRAVFAELGLEVGEWRDRLRIYPPPVDWLLGRSLHFIAGLRPRRLTSAERAHSRGDTPGSPGRR